MVRVDGGYVILNYMLFRDKDHTASRRAKRYRAARAARTLAAENPSSRVTTVASRDGTPNVTQADADAYLRGEGPAEKPKGAELILREHELGRVEARLVAIRQGYEAHQDMSLHDRAEVKTLKARREELKRMLGLAV